jgi:pimeloyl-ACP methyl ester carboxylesterase
MQRVTIDGFAALAWNDGAGLPVVYLHGFPDHPPTATPFLEALAARGHRVLAPWLRGYAPSPLGGPYDLDTLAADVCALVDRWSPDRPVALVGHDWGAAITYALCDAAPARIARAVTLALPHPLTFLRRLRRLDQLRRSWYMLAFQLPGAGRVAAARDLALVDHLWRTWSPGFALDPAARRELHACLAAPHQAAPRPAARAAAAPAPRRARRLRPAARRRRRAPLRRPARLRGRPRRGALPASRAARAPGRARRRVARGVTATPRGAAAARRPARSARAAA